MIQEHHTFSFLLKSFRCESFRYQSCRIEYYYYLYIRIFVHNGILVVTELKCIRVFTNDNTPITKQPAVIRTLSFPNTS